MSEYRWNIEASAGPAREGLPGCGGRLMIRVRLFNVPDPCGASDRPDVVADIRTPCARELALALLAAAADAERLHRHPGTDGEPGR
jgi:hypothetical protein